MKKHTLLIIGLGCALFCLSACESTQNDLSDLLNNTAQRAGKSAGR